MKIKREWVFTGTVAAALSLVTPNLPASAPDGTGLPSQMVVTVRPAHAGSAAPASLQASDVTIAQDNINMPVIQLQRLAGQFADMQLFVFLDDSTRSASLGIQLPELKQFVNSLPATTQVAVGYMRNGTFALAQAFTADHRQAANSLRLPTAIPGENGSPYFALSDLAKHWPSNQAADRRTVLMFTDGVDRYYDMSSVDDPYVDAAVRDALKGGIAVYSVYLRGAGDFSRYGRAANLAQSRLIEVGDQTGGYAYFQGFGDPVSIAPFMDDFRNRLANQYKLTYDEAKAAHGVQAVKLRTELPGIKIEAPTRIYMR
jgi:hypothetical protein